MIVRLKMTTTQFYKWIVPLAEKNKWSDVDFWHKVNDLKNDLKDIRTKGEQN